MFIEDVRGLEHQFQYICFVLGGMIFWIAPIFFPAPMEFVKILDVQ